MKRFYKFVSLSQTPNGWAVHLDGKPVKTPVRKDLIISQDNLAKAIMAEWSAQIETINPETMPLTQIVMTALDKVSPARTVFEEELLAYLDTDLLCYRAPEGDRYGQKQKAVWDPVLAWFAERFGVQLQTTTALSALHQPDQAHSAVRKYVTDLDDVQFTALHIVTAETGSLVLALAVLEGALSPLAVFEATLVEELIRADIYLESEYGPSPDQEKKRAVLKRELDGVDRLLGLYRSVD